MGALKRVEECSHLFLTHSLVKAPHMKPLCAPVHSQDSFRMGVNADFSDGLS